MITTVIRLLKWCELFFTQNPRKAILYHMTALKNMNSTDIKNSIPIESVPTLILFQAL